MMPRERHLRLGGASFAHPAASPGGPGCAEDLTSSTRSRVVLARQVATLGKADQAGELELDEREEQRVRGYSPLWAALPRSASAGPLPGSAASEGLTGTFGFSISPRRSIRRSHCSGFRT